MILWQRNVPKIGVRTMASHQALDPENKDILYGSTSSLWDARHPVSYTHLTLPTKA